MIEFRFMAPMVMSRRGRNPSYTIPPISRLRAPRLSILLAISFSCRLESTSRSISQRARVEVKKGMKGILPSRPPVKPRYVDVHWLKIVVDCTDACLCSSLLYWFRLYVSVSLTKTFNFLLCNISSRISSSLIDFISICICICVLFPYSIYPILCFFTSRLLILTFPLCGHPFTGVGASYLQGDKKHLPKDYTVPLMVRQEALASNIAFSSRLQYNIL